MMEGKIVECAVYNKSIYIANVWYDISHLKDITVLLRAVLHRSTYICCAERILDEWCVGSSISGPRDKTERLVAKSNGAFQYGSVFQIRHLCRNEIHYPHVF